MDVAAWWITNLERKQETEKKEPVEVESKKAKAAINEKEGFNLQKLMISLNLSADNFKVFKDLFEIAAHKRTNHLDMQKLVYLINLLEGEAEKLSQPYHIGATNIQVAVSL